MTLTKLRRHQVAQEELWDDCARGDVAGIKLQIADRKDLDLPIQELEAKIQALKNELDEMPRDSDPASSAEEKWSLIQAEAELVFRQLSLGTGTNLISKEVLIDAHSGSRPRRVLEKQFSKMDANADGDGESNPTAFRVG